MGVSEIEKAIEELSPAELSELSAWFDKFENDRWDRQIETDSLNGRFRAMIEQATADHEAGRTREL